MDGDGAKLSRHFFPFRNGWASFSVGHGSFCVSRNPCDLNHLQSTHARMAIESHGVTLPLWLPLLLVGVIAFAAWRRSRGHAPGCCRMCGYDLTGNISGVCPECGAPVAG